MSNSMRWTRREWIGAGLAGMTEYKNWAAFDGITAKFDAIGAKIVGSEEKQVQLMTKRTETREIIGNKTMQELIIK